MGPGNKCDVITYDIIIICIFIDLSRLPGSKNSGMRLYVCFTVKLVFITTIIDSEKIYGSAKRLFLELCSIKPTGYLRTASNNVIKSKKSLV